MNARRQRAAARLHRFLYRHGGKLHLSDESVPRLCRDARLAAHELDRAIDDLFFLGAVEVRADDDVSHVVRAAAVPAHIRWDVPNLDR